MDKEFLEDSHGFNRYQATLVYKEAVTEFDRLLNSQTLLDSGNDVVFKLFSMKSSNANLKLNLIEMSFLLQGINNLAFLEVILKSSSFQSLFPAQKVGLIAEGVDMKNYFYTIFENLDEESLNILIKAEYKYGKNLLDHLLHLQGDYSKQIKKVIEKMHSYSDQEIIKILNKDNEGSVLQDLVMLQGDHLNDLKEVLQSEMFKKLDNKAKATLLTEGGSGSALIQSIFKEQYFDIITKNLISDDVSDIFQNEKFAREYLEHSLSKLRCFDYIFENLNEESLNILIKAEYKYGKNLLDHLLHLQGDYSKQIKKVIEKMHSYSDQEIIKILNKDNEGSVLQDLVMLQGDHLNDLKEVLQSEMFKKLDNKAKATLLTEGGSGSALIQSIFKEQYFDIITKNLISDDVSDIFQNEKFAREYLEHSLSKLRCFDYIFENLNEESLNILIKAEYKYGKNLLDHLLHLQGDYSKQIKKVIEKMHSYSDQEIIKILNKDNEGSVLQDLVMLQGDHLNDLKEVLQSEMFKKLDNKAKATLLTEGGSGSALNQVYLKDNLEYLKLLLESKHLGIIKEIIGSIKDIPLKKLPSIINIFSQFDFLKDVIDHHGFSILYHLNYRPIDNAILQNKGFEEIMPHGFKIDYFENYEYYSHVNNRKIAFMFIGKDHNGANDIPGTHTFLMKGYNIINVDARRKDLTPEDVYKVARKFLDIEIDLFIIQSHGSEDSITKVRHTIPISGNRIEKTEKNESGSTIFYSEGVIYTVDFLKELSSAIGNKAISVFLTSCKGQLAAEDFEQMLPLGSEILTISEYQTLLEQKQDINTIDTNVQNLYQLLLKSKLYNSDNINLKLLAIIYSSEITSGMNDAGYGSPFYSKILHENIDHYSCIAAAKDIDLSLIVSKKSKYLSYFENSDEASRYFDDFVLNPNLHSAKELMDLRSSENFDMHNYAMKLSLNCWIGSLENEASYMHTDL